MKQSALQGIAKQLIGQALAGRPALHRLPRGLSLDVRRQGDHVVLSLSRSERAGPSDLEIAICRRAFGVPEEAAGERRHDVRYEVAWTPVVARTFGCRGAAAFARIDPVLPADGGPSWPVDGPADPLPEERAPVRTPRVGFLLGVSGVPVPLPERRIVADLSDPWIVLQRQQYDQAVAAGNGAEVARLGELLQRLGVQHGA